MSPDTQNAPSVEQARLRRLLASSRDGRFSDWSPMKRAYRHAKNGEKRTSHCYSLSVARRERTLPASTPRTEISEIPDP